jgi:hypothetical protein
MVFVPESDVSLARVWGSPGENARAAGLFRTLWPIFGLVAVTGYVLGAAAPLPGVPRLAYGLALIVLAALLVRSMYWSQGRLRNYFKGARGEEQAARQLALLPAPYAVFHSVSIPGVGRPGAGDFDHVVVGPNGLFLVETKNWKGHVSVRDGRLLVDGKVPDFSPLREVGQAAAMLHDWLKAETRHSVAVRPMLYFVSSEIRNGKAESEGVVITGAEDLRPVILKDRSDDLNEGVRVAIIERLSRQVQS